LRLVLPPRYRLLEWGLSFMRLPLLSKAVELLCSMMGLALATISYLAHALSLLPSPSSGSIKDADAPSIRKWIDDRLGRFMN
jgi:hypothetical protein